MSPANPEPVPTSRRSRRVATVLVTALALLAAPGTANRSRAAEPIRGAYFYFYLPLDHLDALAASGFTTGLIKYFQPSFSADVLADAARKRARADSLGLDLFLTLNVHNRDLLASGASSGRRFRDRRGTVHDSVPCPADTMYWSAFVAAMMAPMAHATAAPARIALDLELYDSGIAHYPPGPCTCRSCRLEYAGYTGPNRALAEPWIDLLPLRDFENLERAERDRLTDFLAGRINALCESVPLELAVLDLGRENVVTTALVDAAARAGLPLIDFTELTYSEGSAMPHAELAASYARQSAHVRTVGGLWLKQWPPDRLEEEAVRLGRREAGYWIFTSLSLALPPEELAGPYVLAGSQAATWEALSAANRRLIPPN